MKTPTNALPGRYKPVLINGLIRHVRDKATLQADAIALLTEHGPMSKRAITIELRSVNWIVEEALNEAKAEGKVERFLALSRRRRLDEFWCAAGAIPQDSNTRFNATSILTAMQQHARFLATGAKA